MCHAFVDSIYKGENESQLILKMILWDRLYFTLSIYRQVSGITENLRNLLKDTQLVRARDKNLTQIVWPWSLSSNHDIKLFLIVLCSERSFEMGVKAVIRISKWVEKRRTKCFQSNRDARQKSTLGLKQAAFAIMGDVFIQRWTSDSRPRARNDWNNPLGDQPLSGSSDHGMKLQSRVWTCRYYFNDKIWGKRFPFHCPES